MHCIIESYCFILISTAKCMNTWLFLMERQTKCSAIPKNLAVNVAITFSQLYRVLGFVRLYVRLYVSIQCVSCFPCHRWWQSFCVWVVLKGAPRWHLSSRCRPQGHRCYRARGCTVPARGTLAPDPQGRPIRRCCSVSVYLCFRSSSFFISIWKSFRWQLTPPLPLRTSSLLPNPSPIPSLPTNL